MSAPVSLLLADDHPIYRLGLREAVDRMDAFTVVGEAEDGEVAWDEINRHQPEIALLDIDMPKMSGLELAEKIGESKLGVKVVILTSYKEESFFNRAMDLGVRGYVLKENAIHDLKAALQAVSRGEVFLSPSISSYLLNRVQRLEQRESKVASLDLLTPMELRVLRLISENKTNKEIGELLFISPRTVNTHRTNMSNKLSLSGSRGLLLFALEHKTDLACVKWLPGDA